MRRARGYTVELRPTPEQVAMFKGRAGIGRLSWNWMLGEWGRIYREHRLQDALLAVGRGENSLPSLYALQDVLEALKWKVERLKPELPAHASKKERQTWEIGWSFTSPTGETHRIEPTQRPKGSKNRAKEELDRIRKASTEPVLAWATEKTTLRTDALSLAMRRKAEFVPYDNPRKHKTHKRKEPLEGKLAKPKKPSKKDPDNPFPSPDYNLVRSKFVEWKHEQVAKGNDWLNSPFEIVREKAMDLKKSFSAFFDPKNTRAGYPKFHSRDSTRTSFRMDGPCIVTRNHIQFTSPKWGMVLKFKRVGYLPEFDLRKVKGVEGSNAGWGPAIVPTGRPPLRICSMTISRSADRWFLALNVIETLDDPLPRSGPILGIDVGARKDGSNLAVLADRAGNEIARYPKDLPGYDLGKAIAHIEALKHDIKVAGRVMSRRFSVLKKDTEGKRIGQQSQRWEKAKLRLQRLHWRLASARKNLLHQVTNRIVKLGGSVYVSQEHNVQGMMQNGRLAPTIADAGMFSFHEMLKYKTEWAGAKFVKSDQWYPSTKRCSRCGELNNPGSGEVYQCGKCGLVINRDLNAAINEVLWYELHASSSVEAPVGPDNGSTLEDPEIAAQ